MSEGPLPRNWKEAIPYVVWGIIALGFGLEAVAAFTHGEWGRAFVSLAGLVGVMTAALHHQQIRTWFSTLDARWVALLLFLALIALFVSSMLEDRAGGAVTWTLIGVAVSAIVAALLVLYWHIWSKTVIAAAAIRGYDTKNQSGGDTLSATGVVSPVMMLDGQTRLDLVHLLDFAVSQSTLVMLGYLVELASLPEVTDRINQSGEHSDEGQKSKRWYIGYVGQQLGAGTHRHASFRGVMDTAEGDAEQQLATMSEDKRPPGINVVTLRRWMITDLQFTRTIQFLGNQRRELQDSMLGRRSRLIERLNQRQQGAMG
jgi:hypothetical protein